MRYDPTEIRFYVLKDFMCDTQYTSWSLALYTFGSISLNKALLFTFGHPMYLFMTFFIGQADAVGLSLGVRANGDLTIAFTLLQEQSNGHDVLSLVSK